MHWYYDCLEISRAADALIRFPPAETRREVELILLESFEIHTTFGLLEIENAKFGLMARNRKFEIRRPRLGGRPTLKKNLFRDWKRLLSSIQLFSVANIFHHPPSDVQNFLSPKAPDNHFLDPCLSPLVSSFYVSCSHANKTINILGSHPVHLLCVIWIYLLLYLLLENLLVVHQEDSHAQDCLLAQNDLEWPNCYVGSFLFGHI